MNVQQGDLAYLKSTPGLAKLFREAGCNTSVNRLGTIVRVVRYFAKQASAKGSPGLVLNDIWIIDPPLIGTTGQPTPYCPDEMLRPIRDQPGTDEMIRIAGLPSQIKETV